MNILSNLWLPVSSPYSLKTFSDYIPTPGLKYTSLKAVLDVIPPEEKPQAVLINSPEYLPVPEDIASFPGYKILLITDWNVCLRFLEDICPMFDFCFTDLRGFEILKSWGVPNIYHQPLFGHDASIFYTENNGDIEERKYDITFCGNFNQGMHSARNRLLGKFAGLSLKYKVYVGQLFGKDYVNILNQSKLVWNHSIRSEANMRTFEAMACGAVPLIESGNQEVPLLFQEGVHYLEYNEDSLEYCIARYLQLPAHTKAAMSQAAQVVVSNQTKAVQIRDLLDKVISAGRIKPPRVISFGEGVNSGLKTRPLKAVIKSNLMGNGFANEDMHVVLNAICKRLPDLELELLPALILQGVGQGTLKNNVSGDIFSMLEHKFNAPTIMPAPLGAYFLMYIHFLKKEYAQCIQKSKTCQQLLSNLINSPDALPERQRLYDYLVPPLDLFSGMRIDSNHTIIEDKRTGQFMEICSLFIDNCLGYAADSYLKLGEVHKSLAMADAISNKGFLSSNKLCRQARALELSGDKNRAMSTFEQLFEQQPATTSNWSIILNGCLHYMELPGAFQYIERFINITRTIFHQDKSLIHSLHITIDRFKDAQKRCENGP